VDGVYLVDSSAFVRAHQPSVRGAWAQAAAEGRLIASPMFRFETLFSARGAGEFDRVERGLRSMEFLRFSETVEPLAVAAMRSLARSAGLAHRVPVPDLLIAAAAAEQGMGVLHYDAHYDRLAEVLDFESRWIAPAGSLP
jgi:predicted nucleic acid-binding protein